MKLVINSISELRDSPARSCDGVVLAPSDQSWHFTTFTQLFKHSSLLSHSLIKETWKSHQFVADHSEIDMIDRTGTFAVCSAS